MLGGPRQLASQLTAGQCQHEIPIYTGDSCPLQLTMAIALMCHDDALYKFTFYLLTYTDLNRNPD